MCVALGIWFCLSAMGWNPYQAFLVACLGAGIGFTRFMQGIHRRTALKVLGKSFIFTKSLQWIQDKKKALKKQSNIYLGEGFVWGQEHVQAFMEVATLPEKSRYFDQLPPEGGLPYIHGVGPYLNPNDDKPIVLPLPEHTSLHGTTGIGKTRLIELIVSQLIQQQEPVVILDPKSDSKLLDAVYQACVNIGCADKFEYSALRTLRSAPA
jgi:Type IV secretion-system coupling protein DNA-binding domain.